MRPAGSDPFFRPARTPTPNTHPIVGVVFVGIPPAVNKGAAVDNLPAFPPRAAVPLKPSPQRQA